MAEATVSPGRKVLSENSTKLQGSWCTCYWKPQHFPWETHGLIMSSVGPLGHPRVFLLMPGHWQVTPWSSGYKLISLRIVLSRSIRGQDPVMGGTAYMLHPKIRIFCNQVKGDGGWTLCRQPGWWTEVHQGLWLMDGAETGTQSPPLLGP